VLFYQFEQLRQMTKVMTSAILSVWATETNDYSNDK
jgi:hypothetical protein